MKIAIGHSRLTDAFQSGQAVIQQATAHSDLDHVDIAIAFCTQDMNAEQFLRGLRSQLGENTPIYGSTTVGIIAKDTMAYLNSAANVLLIQSEGVEIRHQGLSGIHQDTEHVGRRLAEHLGIQATDQFLLLFYGMIKNPPTTTKPPRMNSLKSILRGMHSLIPNEFPIFGGGMLGDYHFTPARVFYNHSIDPQNMWALAFGGDMSFYHTIMHGCTPFDGTYHTITKHYGAIIRELNHRPAAEVLDEIFGKPDWRTEIPIKDLTVGVNLGEKYGPFQESNYVTRLISGFMKKSNSIMTPEPDWCDGNEIQFMIRDNENMMASADLYSRALLQKILKDGKQPLLGFYIDCAGRTALFCNSIKEEAKVVQSVFQEFQVPLFGMYSGIEVAPLLGVSRGLEWTGVLVVFATN